MVSIVQFISQCDSVSLRHLPVDCWRQSRVLYQNWLGYLHLKQLKTCWNACWNLLNAEDEISCGSAKIFPSTSHAPIISTLAPNLTTTLLPTNSPAVCTPTNLPAQSKSTSITMIHSIMQNSRYLFYLIECFSMSSSRIRATSDQFRDCKDGTDESSCSCADVLRGKQNF